MKKIIAVSLVLALSGCGDDNDMALKRQGMIGSDVAIPNTSKPNKPDKPDANWKYSSIASGSKVLSLSATTYSLNTYPKPENKNVEGRPWVRIERTKSQDDVVVDTVVIFADSKVSCTPSCDVPMSFDGTRATYRMQNTTSGVLRPNDTATGKTLYKKFISSNKATVTLPIIGLDKPFEANFDLRNYDLKRMSF